MPEICKKDAPSAKPALSENGYGAACVSSLTAPVFLWGSSFGALRPFADFGLFEIAGENHLRVGLTAADPVPGVFRGDDPGQIGSIPGKGSKTSPTGKKIRTAVCPPWTDKQEYAESTLYIRPGMWYNNYR